MDCNTEVARILREELAERFYLIGALVTPDKAESIDHEVDTVVCDSVRLCERLAESLETGKVPEPGPSDLSEPQFNAEVLKRLSEGYDLVPHRELGLLAKELARGKKERDDSPDEAQDAAPAHPAQDWLDRKLSEPDPERSLYKRRLSILPVPKFETARDVVAWLKECEHWLFVAAVQQERDPNADPKFAVAMILEVACAIATSSESLKTGVAPNVEGVVNDDNVSRALAAARGLTQGDVGDMEDIALLLELAERSTGGAGASA